MTCIVDYSQNIPRPDLQFMCRWGTYCPTLSEMFINRWEILKVTTV